MQTNSENELYEIYRIIDANINRANEGIRVTEEYFRFIIENIDIQKSLKNCRHILNDIVVKFFDKKRLFESRNSTDDIGASYSTDSEMKRPYAKSIAEANIKRSQEALRCLEEYSKRIIPEASEQFKNIRFELYGIEKLLFFSAKS